jgi:S-adenosyl-L-methionine hydrolase (adenosine-forming)
MGIVTLTTDLGYRDPYLAIVKAGLMSSEVPMQILDLSCEVKENNVSDAAFIVRNALPHFPAGTIHLVGLKFLVDRSQLNGHSADNSRYLVTRYNDQYIVTPDTGLFTLVDPAFREEVYQLYYEGQSSHHFFMKDIFVPAALHLLQGKPLGEIAAPTSDYYKAHSFQSYVDKNILRGKGIYIDDFGNIITNITRSNFSDAVGGRSFVITLPGLRISKIHNTYDEVNYGSPVVLFNSLGNLEVAVNGKSAYSMLCPRDIGRQFDFNILVEIL